MNNRILAAIGMLVAAAPAWCVDAPEIAPASQPEATLTATAQRALVVAIAKWRGEDFAAAGTDLARLINAATPQERTALSSLARSTTGLELAELAADAHFRAALAARRGPAIRLPYSTDYEKPALARRLIAAFEAAIHETGEPAGFASAPLATARRSPVATSQPATPGSRLPTANSRPSIADPRMPIADSRSPIADPRMPIVDSRSPIADSPPPWYAAYSPQTRPASGPADADTQYAVVDWLDRPESFNGTPEQAEALAERTNHALSLLNERVRIDPALRRDAELNRGLLDRRQRLIRLSRVLKLWMERSRAAGATARDAAREQARRDRLQRDLESQRADHEKRVQELREHARKWQVQEQKTSAKPSRGLFNWSIPREEKSTPPQTGP